MAVKKKKEKKNGERRKGRNEEKKTIWQRWKAKTKKNILTNFCFKSEGGRQRE